jgi:hypothetical protein
VFAVLSFSLIAWRCILSIPCGHAAQIRCLVALSCVRCMPCVPCVRPVRPVIVESLRRATPGASVDIHGRLGRQ